MDSTLECQTTSVQMKQAIRCVGHVYGHHASRSGYQHLAHYLGGEWSLSGVSRWLGDTFLRIPTKLYSQRCRLEYSRHSVMMELEILARTLTGGGGIWHHLYGEKTYQLCGFLKDFRRDRQVATFHHHPARYGELVPNAKHFRSLDQAIVVSSVQQDMIGDLVGKDKVKCIPHGVDTEYWHPKHVNNSARRKLVFAGTHMRDLDALEKIVKALLELRDDVEFVLVSSDLRCAEIANRRNVRWLYRVSDESYRSELQEAELTVLPLQHSTAVNTVLESVACGTPVVTTVGGVSDYLDASCAISLEANKCDDFVDAIMMLLDRANPEEMRRAARRKAEGMSWEKVSGTVRRGYIALF